MNQSKIIFTLLGIFCFVAIVRSADRPTTRPTTQPADAVPVQADSIMGRMLQHSDSHQPIEPEPNPPAPDATSGMGAVPPKAPTVLLRPEGYYIIGRLARFGDSKDGFRELIFDSDGQAMRDPPMRILPNQLLNLMEDQAKISAAPMAFRISGLITVYKDHNYILIDKAVQEPRNQGPHE